MVCVEKLIRMTAEERAAIGADLSQAVVEQCDLPLFIARLTRELEACLN